jgi:putative spermidine/putrescine transport system ATP-binding protein
VFQTYALFPHMSVADNVSFGLEMRKMPKAERSERVKQALALVHLEPHATRYPRELSGGQRQRVALARALVIEPPVLLLDEPLSNLDAKLREEMQFELRQIQRKVGTTTVMVTHDQSEAMSISDRVVVMEGRPRHADRPSAAGVRTPAHRFISTFVGKANLLKGCVVPCRRHAARGWTWARWRSTWTRPAATACAGAVQRAAREAAAGGRGPRAASTARCASASSSAASGCMR